MDGAALGGKKIVTSVKTLIIDTGTSFLLVPKRDYENII
jgi:predicted aspartyl protease